MDNEDTAVRITTPRRFKIVGDDVKRPFDKALRFGVYFPDTDLVVNDMGRCGTGCPKGPSIEWIDS